MLAVQDKLPCSSQQNGNLSSDLPTSVRSSRWFARVPPLARAELCPVLPACPYLEGLLIGCPSTGSSNKQKVQDVSIPGSIISLRPR